jgi:O-antigen/teichoic acid export membrane protein
VSFAQKAFQASVWLAAFQFVTQLWSWSVTILIARLLLPEDYGLVAMATLLTSYVEIVSELGIGSAIVQRSSVTNEDLNGVFWLGIGTGIGFAGLGVLLAFVTAWVFDDQRIVPLTQFASLQFVLGGLLVVPHSLLMREVRFKEIGIIHLCAVGLGSVTSLGLAWWGWGVWALLGGYLMQRVVLVVLSYYVSGWRPGGKCNWANVRPFLDFGLKVTGSGTAYYVFQRADQFVVGRLFTAQVLGYYSMALQLASLPPEKVVVLIRKIAYPVFAHYQDDPLKCRLMFLHATQYMMLMVAPLLVGGAIFGEELILVSLGNQWEPVIPLFRVLCVAQLFMALATLTGMVQTALGVPQRVLAFNSILAVLMPLSVLIAAQAGFEFVVVPWVTIFPIVCMVWIRSVLNTLGIDPLSYLKQFVAPLLACLVMIVGVLSSQAVFGAVFPSFRELPLRVAQEIALGGLLYIGYLILFDRSIVKRLWALHRGDS